MPANYEYPIRYLARAWLPIHAAASTVAAFQRFAQLVGRDDLVPLPLQEGPMLGFGVPVRPGLGTPDSSWRYLMRSDSVDVEFHPALGAEVPTFSAFLAAAAQVLASVARGLAVQASRIAAVQEGVLRETSPGDLGHARNQLLRVPAALGGDEPFEWDWRACTKISRHFGQHEESGNTIVTVKRVGITLATAPGTSVDRLYLSSDINTDPLDARARFTPDDIEAFLLASADWHDALVEPTQRSLRVQP